MIFRNEKPRNSRKGSQESNVVMTIRSQRSHKVTRVVKGHLARSYTGVGREVSVRGAKWQRLENTWVP